MYFMSIKHCKELLIIVRNDLILQAMTSHQQTQMGMMKPLVCLVVPTAKLSVAERKHGTRGWSLLKDRNLL